MSQADPFTLTATGGFDRPMVASRQMLRRGIELFADPEHGCELMALKSGQSVRLPGSNIDGLVEAAEELPGGVGLYIRLNPVAPDLDRPALVGDIIRRRWLYIDVDSVKETGKQSESATEQEKREAYKVFVSVQNELKSIGWPDPMTVDSGNGYAMYWRIDEPVDDEYRTLYKSFLKALAERFAGIDPAIINANRLTKLPGTWARKGEDTQDRPHRHCRLLSVPSTFPVVGRDLLRLVIPETPPAPPSLPITMPVTMNGEHPHQYATAALTGELDAILQAPEGSRNEQLNTSAFRIGQLVGRDMIDRTEVEQPLIDAGRQSEPDRFDQESVVRRALDAGIKHPRISIPEFQADPNAYFGESSDQAQGEQTAGQSKAYWELVLDDEVIAGGEPSEFTIEQTKSAAGNTVFRMHTFAGLMQRDFPEPNWVVPGLFSEGLNILAGKPKMGKSMLALNLAITVAGGGQYLQSMPVNQGDVLYLSLEDRFRRLKSRSAKMLKALPQAGERLILTPEWPRQGAGGLELIEWWAKRAANPTLVIIDVWTKFRPAANIKANAYSEDYAAMSPLKDLMDRFGCCGLALLHCRKGTSEDIVDDISGTLGIGGSADGIVVLNRIRNDNEAKIFITGRDVVEQELALQFDETSLTWASLGPADKHVSGKLEKAIVDYLRLRTGSPATVQEICDHLKDNNKYSNPNVDSIRRVCHRLVEKRILDKHNSKFLMPVQETDDDGM